MCFTIPEQKDKNLFIPCSSLLDQPKFSLSNTLHGGVDSN